MSTAVELGFLVSTGIMRFQNYTAKWQFLPTRGKGGRKDRNQKRCRVAVRVP